MNTPYKKRGRRPRLPSIESQTIAFLEWARKKSRPIATTLKWDGNHIYLRYWRHGYLPPPWENAEILVIANITVKESYRRRNWFWRYCQLCAALTKHGVVIESVLNERLFKALCRHPEFIQYRSECFYLKKESFEEWPLTLDWIDVGHDPHLAGKHRT